MPLEVEVRFRIPNTLVRDKLVNSAEVNTLAMRDFRAVEMCAEYYDSPKHSLKAHHSTLRRRLEGGRPQVSFKSSTEGREHLLAREKWQCDADEISVAIGILMDMGAPEYLGEYARAEGYLARGRFEYTRRGVPLMFSDGTVVELDVDEGRVLADGKRENMLEVVLKLLYGDPAVLVEFARTIEVTYELTREMCSKYERALRLVRSRG
ncbi:hypothetical protein FACS1894217_08640 [Clostridia bacterium]|nr:hypothetical protein FACS1894217_08640 [Clostridia bacterium]